MFTTNSFIGSIVRLNRDGSRDKEFDASWLRQESPFDVAVLRTGHILICGKMNLMLGQFHSPVVLRLNPDGTWDDSYPPLLRWDYDVPRSMTPDPDGLHVIVTGGKQFLRAATVARPSLSVARRNDLNELAVVLSGDTGWSYRVEKSSHLVQCLTIG